MTLLLSLVLSQASLVPSASAESMITSHRLLAPDGAAVGTASKPIGQRPVSIALGAVAVLAGGLGLGLGVNATDLAAQANQANSEYFFKILGSQAQASAGAANVTFAIAGAAVVGAVIAFFVEGAG